MSSYISYFTPQSWTRAQKNKADLEKTNPTNPVLNEEDEQFLERITSVEGPAPTLPDRPAKSEGREQGVVIEQDGNAEVKGEEEVKQVEEEVKKTEKAAEGKAEEKTDEDQPEKTKDGQANDKNNKKDDQSQSDKADLEHQDVVDGLAVGGGQSSADGATGKENISKDVSSKDGASDATPDKTEEIIEASTIAPLEPEKEDKMSKSWASYVPSISSIPSIPTLPSMPKFNKKKDADSTKTSPDAQAKDDEKTEATSTEHPESPKSKKAKKDPFPTQEEAEASTAAGAKLVADASSSSPSTETHTGRQTEDVSNPRNWSSYIPSLSRGTPQEATAASLASMVKKGKQNEAPLKNADGTQTDDEKEVSVLLDRMNLSAINNRVFSFSKDSQKVYESFTIVLKDIVNGGPTAYEDLEKLIKDNEGHLDQMFGNMPPFVQTLVKSLPTKVMGSLGPEVLAAMSEKPGADMQAQMKAESSSSASASAPASGVDGKKKQKRKIPSAKALVSQQGAVASMLKSILNFLKLRFPAFVTGTNVLMSLAVFILLFVFWYCHKRGKEVRLLAEEANKASGAEISESEESSELEDSVELEKPALDTEDATAESKKNDDSNDETAKDKKEDDSEESVLQREKGGEGDAIAGEGARDVAKEDMEAFHENEDKSAK